MNLKSLEDFIEVAKDLNMTSAAQRLYISQQALSSQILKLEQYYGVTLFERQPKLRLTFAGQRLLEGAERIVQESIAVTNSLTDLSKTHSGLLRIGIPTFRAQQCFPLILAEYTKKWPNVSISLEEPNTTQMLEMLLNGALDVCIVAPSETELRMLSDRLDFTFLLDDRTYLVCSDELLQRCYGSRAEEMKKNALLGTDMREFQDLPLILHKPPMKLRQVADECFNNAGIKPNVFMETGNTELMIAMYSCHVGAFFSRKSRLRSIRQLYPDCNAFPVRYADAPHTSTVYFARRKSQRTPPHILDFERLMQRAWKVISEH